MSRTWANVDGLSPAEIVKYLLRRGLTTPAMPVASLRLVKAVPLGHVLRVELQDGRAFRIQVTPEPTRDNT